MRLRFSNPWKRARQSSNDAHQARQDMAYANETARLLAVRLGVAKNYAGLYCLGIDFRSLGEDARALDRQEGALRRMEPTDEATK